MGSRLLDDPLLRLRAQGGSAPHGPLAGGARALRSGRAGTTGGRRKLCPDRGPSVLRVVFLPAVCGSAMGPGHLAGDLAGLPADREVGWESCRRPWSASWWQRGSGPAGESRVRGRDDLRLRRSRQNHRRVRRHHDPNHVCSLQPAGMVPSAAGSPLGRRPAPCIRWTSEARRYRLRHGAAPTERAARAWPLLVATPATSPE